MIVTNFKGAYKLVYLIKEAQKIILKTRSSNLITRYNLFLTHEHIEINKYFQIFIIHANNYLIIITQQNPHSSPHSSTTHVMQFDTIHILIRT